MSDVKIVKVKDIPLGDGNIYIQSMSNIISSDIEKNVLQAKQAVLNGCDIWRIAIPNLQAIKLIPAIKENVDIPLVADIHFDYKLALESVEAGIDKIRINPGNIGSDDKIKKVVTACKNKNIPIRIGVNSGSLEKEILAKYGFGNPEGLVESALNHVRILEKFDFDDIVISIKSSDVKNTVKAYRLIKEKCNYPLHLGITEAGTYNMGVIKSSIGIGSLLLDNIGDTIRVSLTDDPIKEIITAKNILKAIGLKNDEINFISCPTCGRTQIDIISITKQVEKALEHIKKPITVAIMGCAVNGPGEARDADIGIAGGIGEAVLFKKGQIIRKINEDEIITELINEINSL